MPQTLEIRKISNNVWKHIDSVTGAYILTKFYAKYEFNKFFIVEIYGSKRFEYPLTDISVYDIGGSAETFASFEALFLRLAQLNYRGYNEDGVFIFNPADYISLDAGNALVLGTDNRYYVPISGGSSTWGGITGTLEEQLDLKSALDAKQDTLVSGTNIKTINGNSVLGSGNLVVGGSSEFIIISTTDSPTLTGTTALTILVADVLIPAGTILSGDNVYFSMSAERVVSVSSNSAFTLAIAPASGITDPVAGSLTSTYKLTGIVMGTTNTQMDSDHILKIKGTSITNINSFSLFSDKTQSAIKLSNTSIDWSVNQYLYIYANNAQTTTQTKITGFRFERKRST